MSEKKIAIIHTGFHKTGSSSVQHTLANNRSLLEGSGYHYPDIDINGVRFYNCSVPLYGRYSDHPENFLQYWYHNNLDAEFANNKIDKVFKESIFDKQKLVFSDEFVSRLSVAELTKLRDDFVDNGYKLRVISYVREPFNLLVSVVQQQSRRESIDSTLTSSCLNDECNKIENLISVFGDDAEFYNFESVCNHRSGPAGFLLSLIDVDLMVDQSFQVNEGMSDQAVRLLGFINGKGSLLNGPSKINPIRRKFDLDILSGIPGDKFHLTSAELEIVKDKVDVARENIKKILGDDFLPNVSFSSSAKSRWGAEQLDYILSCLDSMDLYVLLRVYDFLNEELPGQNFNGKKRKLALDIRVRLRNEKGFDGSRIGRKFKMLIKSNLIVFRSYFRL